MNIERGYTPEKQSESTINEARITLGNDYDQLRDKTYSIAASRNPGIIVTPATKYCWFVNRAASELLAEGGAHGAYLAHERRDGEVLHKLVVVDEPQSAVVDFQYQQFVPEEDRAGLPDYLHIPFTNKDDVVAGLVKLKIPEEYHSYWVEPLDDTDRFPKQYTSPLYAASIRKPLRTF